MESEEYSYQGFSLEFFPLKKVLMIVSSIKLPLFYMGTLCVTGASKHLKLLQDFTGKKKQHFFLAFFIGFTLWNIFCRFRISVFCWTDLDCWDFCLSCWLFLLIFYFFLRNCLVYNGAGILVFSVKRSVSLLQIYNKAFAVTIPAKLLDIFFIRGIWFKWVLRRCRFFLIF